MTPRDADLLSVLGPGEPVGQTASLYRILRRIGSGGVGVVGVVYEAEDLKLRRHKRRWCAGFQKRYRMES
jgi:hypothetical protein